MAGDQFCIFLGDAPAGLDAVRFSDVLGMIEASYSVLFALRNKYAPGAAIVTTLRFLTAEPLSVQGPGLGLHLAFADTRLRKAPHSYIRLYKTSKRSWPDFRLLQGTTSFWSILRAR